MANAGHTGGILWSEKIPEAQEQLSLSATTTEPVLEARSPCSRSRRRCQEKPSPCERPVDQHWRKSPLSSEDPQPEKQRLRRRKQGETGLGAGGPELLSHLVWPLHLRYFAENQLP